MKRRSHAQSFAYMRCLVSKGRLIREKGRDAWDCMLKYHREHIIKDGKRVYITLEAFLDNLWLVRA